MKHPPLRSSSTKRRATARCPQARGRLVTPGTSGKRPPQWRAPRPVGQSGRISSQPSLSPRSSARWPPACASNPLHPPTNSHRRTGATAPLTAGEEDHESTPKIEPRLAPSRGRIEPTTTPHRPRIEPTSTPSRAQIDCESTRRRPQNDPKSDPKSDPESTPSRPRIDAESSPHRPPLTVNRTRTGPKNDPDATPNQPRNRPPTASNLARTQAGASTPTWLYAKTPPTPPALATLRRLRKGIAPTARVCCARIARKGHGQGRQAETSTAPPHPEPQSRAGAACPPTASTCPRNAGLPFPFTSPVEMCSRQA